MVKPKLDIAGVIDSFYEAAVLPVFWPEALDSLSRIVNARGAMITSPAHTGLVHSPGLAESVAAFFEGGWESRHTRTTAATRLGSSGFVCDQNLISPEAIRQSDYYNGLAIPADVPWFAACGLGEQGAPRVGLSLQRTASQGAFTPREIMRLNRLLPRLRHIRSTACRLAAAENHYLLGALGAFGDAVILLGHDGVELECNDAAHRLFGDGLVRDSGGAVGAQDPAAHVRLRKLIDAACASPVAPIQTVVIQRPGKEPLTVQTSPVVGRARDLFGKARVFMTIATPSARVAHDAASLGTRFRLTPAEARIAVLLLEGQNVTSIAHTLSVSTGAVRFHLKSILPKAGVHRQAEFIAMVAASREARTVTDAAGLS